MQASYKSSFNSPLPVYLGGGKWDSFVPLSLIRDGVANRMEAILLGQVVNGSEQATPYYIWRLIVVFANSICQQAFEDSLPILFERAGCAADERASLLDSWAECTGSTP